MLRLLLLVLALLLLMERRLLRHRGSVMGLLGLERQGLSLSLLQLRATRWKLRRCSQ